MDCDEEYPQTSSTVISYTQQSRSLTTPPPPSVHVLQPPPPDTPDGVMYIGTVPGRTVVSRVGTRKRPSSAISVVQNIQAAVRIPELDNTGAEAEEHRVIVIAETPTDKNARARQNERVRRQYYKDQSTRLREQLAPEIQEWVANTSSGNKKQPNEGQLMYLAAEKIDSQVRELDEKEVELELKNNELQQKDAELQRLRTEAGENAKRLTASKVMCHKFLIIARQMGKAYTFYKSKYNANCEAQKIEAEVFASEPTVDKLVQYANNVAAQQQSRFVAIQDIARHPTPQRPQQNAAAAGCQGALPLPAPAIYPLPTMIGMKQEMDHGQTQQHQDAARNNVRTMIVNGNGMFFQPIRMPLQPQPQRYQIGQIHTSQSSTQPQFMTHHQLNQRQYLQQQFLQNGIHNLRITNAPGQTLPTVYACNPHHQQPLIPVTPQPQPNLLNLKQESMDMPDILNLKQEPMDMPDVGGNPTNPLPPQSQYFYPINTEQSQPLTVPIKSEPEDDDTEREEERNTQQSGTTTVTQSPPKVAQGEAGVKEEFQQETSEVMFNMPGFSEDINVPNHARTYPLHPAYPPEPPAEGGPHWRVLNAEVLLDDENVFKSIFPKFKNFLWHNHLEEKENWKTEVESIFEDLTTKTLQKCKDLQKERELAEAELEKNKTKGKKRNQDEDTEPKKRGRKKKYGRR